MRYLTRSTLFLAVFFVASTGFAAPWMKVTVFNGESRIAFQGTTGGEGIFSTEALPPGKYVVQFNSTTPAVKGQEYSLVVSAGRKKVIAHTVAGEKFLGGGVAMRIEVGSGLRIKGQIGAAMMTRVDPTTGKRLVWLRPRIGTHLSGRWVPEDSPEFVTMYSAGEVRLDTVSKWQDKGDFGH